MLSWCGIVIIVTGYFFYKVLTVKKKNKPDPCTDNDSQKDER